MRLYAVAGLVFGVGFDGWEQLAHLGSDLQILEKSHEFTVANFGSGLVLECDRGDGGTKWELPPDGTGPWEDPERSEGLGGKHEARWVFDNVLHVFPGPRTTCPLCQAQPDLLD